MRTTYRYRNVKDYWNQRWDQTPADKPMENLSVYPLYYSELTVLNDKKGKILEAGCGAGRLVRYYHDRGFDITGFDYIPVAIQKLKAADCTLKVEIGDITQLGYSDCSFKYVLSFGLYHNLENDLQKAVDETYRVLENSGKVCASFRADNLQTRISDLIENKKRPEKNLDSELHFHKLNLTKKEFVDLFENSGFVVEKVFNVQNMPFLYKFNFFRAKNHKQFNEFIARSEGYQLSLLGKFLQNILIAFLPSQFCNLYVLVAKK